MLSGQGLNITFSSRREKFNCLERTNILLIYTIVCITALIFIIISVKTHDKNIKKINELQDNLNSIKADFAGLDAEKALNDQALRSAVRHLNSISREGQVCMVDFTYNGQLISIADTLQTAAFIMRKVGPCYLYNDNGSSVIVLPCTPYQIREYGNIRVGDKSFWTIEKIES